MSLNYSFPRIRNISDVLPFIDDEHFRVVEKEGLTFINYNMMAPETFPRFPTEIEWDRAQGDEYETYNLGREYEMAAVRRECRGITFDTATGDIVSRPFHKFFNAGERDDVALDKIDISRPHQLLEKLDGSMIRPLLTEHGIRWGTKMGITDVGMLAEEFVAGQYRPDLTYNPYERLAMFCIADGATPLFEFCSRRARIVMDYPQETMVLLAIRDNVTGQYWERWRVRAAAGMWNCPVVDSVDVRAQQVSEEEESISAVADLDVVINSIRTEDEGEGKILVFSDGHAVKIKADWYVRVHRAKDMMRSEMRLLDLVFNEELDDLMSILDADDRHRVDAYLASYYREFGILRDRIAAQYTQVREQYVTKKAFALATSDWSSNWRSVMFALWDGKYGCASDAAVTIIRNAMTAESKFQSMKEAFYLNTDWAEIWANDIKEVAA